MGRPKYHATGLFLDYIEKSTEASAPHLDLIYLALYSYATLLGARYVKIMNPINPKVRDYYEHKGFQYDQKTNSCIRRIIEWPTVLMTLLMTLVRLIMKNSRRFQNKCMRKRVLKSWLKSWKPIEMSVKNLKALLRASQVKMVV